MISFEELGLFTDFSVLIGASDFTSTWVTFTTGFLGAALRVRLLGAVAATVIESDLLGTLSLYKKSGTDVPLCNRFVVKKSSLRTVLEIVENG